MPNSLADHYHQGLRDQDILTQLRAHYPDGPTLHQLAPLDQLHVGGIAASARLLGLLDHSASQVLDMGAGLGGLMRQGAALGLHITGLDITHRFSALNDAISQLAAKPSAPLSSAGTLRCVTGDARALPFRDACFDAVLFQHSLMNMPAPHRVLAECRRVLRPGGQLVMHEVVSGPHCEALRFPVPWAEEPTHSHLLTLAALTQRLQTAGFDIRHCEDWSDTALEWRQCQRQKEQAAHAAVLSPQWVFGERFVQMGKNLLENLANGAINVVEISARC
ncbi:class I SAM-dependent methyltransferase [Halomonas sp. BL6]|uniref:class I SAM-dependent methyltransferase n=1 Tax=Halomonas sp. BL6 TaxID=2585770 RepID=UPI00111B8808|nr:class I SAM-dependent methyltransferase [Halomonas sp. BL6]TNH15790.1 methyltransferase domain-containing protein [Halomonas sp. BL6]